MSLLITEQREKTADQSFSYRNNISNGFIVEPNSEIALVNSTINRGGLLNISKERKLYVFWGNPLPDKEIKYKDDQGDITNEVVPNEEKLPTKDHPWEIVIPIGAYTATRFAKTVQDSLNNQCPHPAFGNLEKRFGASADTIGHFTCTLKLNSVNEFKGFKIGISSEQFNHGANATYPDDKVERIAGSSGSYSGGVLKSGAGDNFTSMFQFLEPIHPSDGGFKFTIKGSEIAKNWIIGLVRNNNKGLSMPLNKNGVSNFDYNILTAQYGQKYDGSIFDPAGADFFDYCLVGNGTDIRLYYLHYSDDIDRYTMKEVEYWNKAVFNGASDFANVVTVGNSDTPIEFYVAHENIIVKLGGKGLSSGQLAAVGTANYSLYPKALIGGMSAAGITINGCSRIQGWDSRKDLSVAYHSDPIKHKILRNSDYWRSLYVKGIIFDMDQNTEEIPAGLWITDYRNSISKSGQVFNVDFNTKQRIVLISGNMTGVLYDVEGNISGFLGMERYEDEPDTDTTTSNIYETARNRVPELNSNNNVHVRINDLEMKTLNGMTASFSRIVGSVPRHMRTGIISSGLLFHEPQNLIFLDLHNKEKMIINSIQIDMVNSNETYAEDLGDYTSNTFLIRKKNN